MEGAVTSMVGPDEADAQQRRPGRARPRAASRSATSVAKSGRLGAPSPGSRRRDRSPSSSTAHHLTTSQPRRSRRRRGRPNTMLAAGRPLATTSDLEGDPPPPGSAGKGRWAREAHSTNSSHQHPGRRSSAATIPGVRKGFLMTDTATEPSANGTGTLIVENGWTDPMARLHLALHRDVGPAACCAVAETLGVWDWSIARPDSGPRQLAYLDRRAVGRREPGHDAGGDLPVGHGASRWRSSSSSLDDRGVTLVPSFGGGSEGGDHLRA